MARAKRKSDEAYNARRRAKRAKERLQRDISSGKLKGDVAKSAQRLVKGLESSISRSYADKTGARAYSERAKQALAEGEAAAKSLKRMRKDDPEERSNFIMSKQLTDAQKKDTYSNISRDESKLLYRLTQRTWEGKNPALRNEMIAAEYGNGSLLEAYKNVMSTPEAKAALEKIRQQSGNIEGYTDENESFYKSEAEDTERYSPVITSVMPL